MLEDIGMAAQRLAMRQAAVELSDCSSEMEARTTVAQTKQQRSPPSVGFVDAAVWQPWL
jgi:hypothetical protein